MVRYDRIWDLSQRRGKSKSFLSVAMGHTKSYLNDARKQNTNIKREELEILAAELETSVEYLTGDTDEQTPPTLNEKGGARQRLLEETRDMNAEELQAVAQYIAFLKSQRP